MKVYILLDRVTGKPINNKAYTDYKQALSDSTLLCCYLYELHIEGVFENAT